LFAVKANMDSDKHYIEFLMQRHKKIHPKPLVGAWEYLPKIFQAMPDWQKDLSYVQQLGRWHDWNTEIDFEKEICQGKKVLVVTDALQRIAFVSADFENMTGYKSLEAVGRKPNFLQGKETSLETVAQVREALAKREPVHANILNYRKTGKPYECNVHISPIFNSVGQLTHFVAMELAL
jgi:PAS domain S-box-containing protein